MNAPTRVHAWWPIIITETARRPRWPSTSHRIPPNSTGNKEGKIDRFSPPRATTPSHRTMVDTSGLVIGPACLCIMIATLISHLTVCRVSILEVESPFDKYTVTCSCTPSRGFVGHGWDSLTLLVIICLGIDTHSWRSGLTKNVAYVNIYT